MGFCSILEIHAEIKMQFKAVFECATGTLIWTFFSKGAARHWVAFQALKAEDRGIKVGRLFVFGIKKGQ